MATALLGLLMATAALAADEQVIASIPQGLSVDDALWRECPLGDYVADAVRQAAGAQVALIPAGLLENALVGDGTVTEEDVTGLFSEDCAVYAYSLTAPQLKALLEDGVSHLRLTERETLDGEASAYGGFLQVSGIALTADATAPVGERVVSVILDGEPLDLADGTYTLTVAIPETLGAGISGTRLEKNLASMTREYIVAQGTVEVPETGRLRVIGAHERDIISVIPVWFVVLLLVILGANRFLAQSRKERS